MAELAFPSTPLLDDEYTDGNSVVWVCTNATGPIWERKGGIADHTALENIGTLTHDQLETAVGLNTTHKDSSHAPTDADNTAANETVTSLSISTNILTFTDENGTDTDIDLSLYLDDTNLAYIASGTLNGGTGIATFTRSDATEFTVDLSALLDDTSVTVNNTLTSTSTTEALSANQGKTLKDTADTLATAVGLNTTKVTNVSTDLGYTASPTNGIVTSSDGTDATLTLATTANAGLLSPAQFDKLALTSGTNTGDQTLTGLDYEPTGTATSTMATHEATHATSDADNTAANETSHATVVVDADFTANGFLKRTSAGVYTVDTNSYILTSHEANNITAGHITILGNTSGTNTGDQTLTGLDYEPTGTAASTISTHTSDHPVPTNRDTRNATAAQGALADSALQSETSHADVLVDGDIGTSVQAYDATLEIGAEVNDANTTLQGNTFNGTSELVQTNSSGQLPAIDGSLLTGIAGGGGIGEFTAFGAISAGDPVALNADSTVSVVEVLGRTVGAAVTMFINTVPYDIEYLQTCYDPDNEVTIAIFQGEDSFNYGRAGVCSITGTTTTFYQSGGGLLSNWCAPLALEYDTLNNKAVAFYKDKNNSYKIYCKVITNSGTSLSFGGATSVSNNALVLFKKPLAVKSASTTTVA